MTNLKLKLIKLLIKSLYKYNKKTDSFDKYFETITDDIYSILK